MNIFTLKGENADKHIHTTRIGKQRNELLLRLLNTQAQSKVMYNKVCILPTVLSQSDWQEEMHRELIERHYLSACGT